MAREPAADAARDVFDERRVGQDQALAQALVGGSAVLLPQRLGVVGLGGHGQRIRGNPAGSSARSQSAEGEQTEPEREGAGSKRDHEESSFLPGGVSRSRRDARKHQCQHEKERTQRAPLPRRSYNRMLEGPRLESLAQPKGRSSTG